MLNRPVYWLIGVGILVFVFCIWWLWHPTPVVVDTTIPVEQTIETEPTAFTQEVIGWSVEGRVIEAFRFGHGDTELLFVGGMHGGYEWNSVILAYAVIDELIAHPEDVPDDLTVTIIPSINPDGVYAVVGKEGRFTAVEAAAATSTALGRFNADDVDLNRNFDCKWQPESTWRGETVSAGTAPFSEPETAALRDYVMAHQPAAVAFWHSQANAVYASECEDGVLPETMTIMDLYGTAAHYKQVASFDAYPITGDSEGWLASIGIPAITVELSSHESVEWTKNWAGVEALLKYYEAADLAR